MVGYSHPRFEPGLLDVYYLLGEKLLDLVDAVLKQHAQVRAITEGELPCEKREGRKEIDYLRSHLESSSHYTSIQVIPFSKSSWELDVLGHAIIYAIETVPDGLEPLEHEGLVFAEDDMASARCSVACGSHHPFVLFISKSLAQEARHILLLHEYGATKGS